MENAGRHFQRCRAARLEPHTEHDEGVTELGEEGCPLLEKGPLWGGDPLGFGTGSSSSLG